MSHPLLCHKRPTLHHGVFVLNQRPSRKRSIWNCSRLISPQSYGSEYLVDHLSMDFINEIIPYSPMVCISSRVKHHAMKLIGLSSAPCDGRRVSVTEGWSPLGEPFPLIVLVFFFGSLQNLQIPALLIHFPTPSSEVVDFRSFLS